MNDTYIFHKIAAFKVQKPYYHSMKHHRQWKYNIDKLTMNEKDMRGDKILQILFTLKYKVMNITFYYYYVYIVWSRK